MKVYIISDHTGIEKRHSLIKYIEQKGIEVIDMGIEEPVSNYAQLGIKLGEAVVNDLDSRGIVMCGTGIGISIACNKVKGVRCALIDVVTNAQLARQHNNANIIALGARTTTLFHMKMIVDAFLETEFQGERHNERIETIKNYENLHR